MSLRQAFVPINMPVVDRDGTPTPAWISFFLSLWNRTNGAAGPTVPWTGSDNEALIAFFQSDQDGASVDVSTAVSAAAAASAAASAASTAASDAQAMEVFADLEPQRSEDQAALLAQLIAD